MWLIGRRKARTLNDAEFGEITERKRGSWVGIQFEIWGYNQVQVLLDADENGPSAVQRRLCRKLRANSENIRQFVEDAVRKRIANTAGLMAPPTNPIRLTSIFFPSDPETADWRIWYDLEGEEMFWFGAEIKPSNEI